MSDKHNELAQMRENIANLEYLLSVVPETVFKKAIQDQIDQCRVKLHELERVIYKAKSRH